MNYALAEYAAAYNSWPHAVTKVPPAELMFGRVVRTVLPRSETGRKQMMDESLRERVQEDKFKRNNREDIRRGAKDLGFSTGDKVLVQQDKVLKTDTVYKNVFNRIINITGKGRVTLMDIESGKIFERNVKQLKKYKEPGSNISEDHGGGEA